MLELWSLYYLLDQEGFSYKELSYMGNEKQRNISKKAS